jgi:hypothetical protein
MRPATGPGWPGNVASTVICCELGNRVGPAGWLHRLVRTIHSSTPSKYDRYMQLPDRVWLESPSLERLETGSIKDSPTGALLDLDGCDQPGF